MAEEEQFTRQEWIAKAKAASELMRRYREERSSFYQPCSPKHKAFHESKAFIRIAFGGNQCGKTLLGLIELLFRACYKTHPYTKEKNPIPGKYRIFTTKFQIAEEHIVPLLKFWIPKKCLKEGSWEKSYDSRYHILTLVNGTVIDILTYDQEASVAESVTLDGIWADEEMPIRMFSGSLPRLVARGGKFWMTVTPLYNLSWAMKYWQSTDPNVFVTKISIFDNPHLKPEFIQNLINNWPENEKAARISGEFLEFSGLFYKELDPRIHLVDPVEGLPKADWPIIFCMDPHPRKPTVMTWAYVTPEEDVVFFDELEVKIESAKQLLEAVRDKEKSFAGKVVMRWADPAAWKQGSDFSSRYNTVDELYRAAQEMQFDFSLAPADNGEAGYNVVRDYIHYDNKQPVSAFNRPRVSFTRNCVKTWEGMTSVMWDEWRTGKDLRDEKERIKDYKKDFPDCVRYTLISRPRFSYNFDAVPVAKYQTFKEPSIFDTFKFEVIKPVHRSN